MAIEHANFEGIERLALVFGESDSRVNTTAVGVCDKILCRASVILCRWDFPVRKSLGI